MITKKFTFIFDKPILVYDELVKEDSIIANDLKEAMRILKANYYHAKIYKVFESPIELYKPEYCYDALPTEVNYKEYINGFEDESKDSL